MTTKSFSTVVEHSSDATFRVWGAEFATALADIGLVKTSDTGQINWSTVTRPGTNTAGGYEIYRFNDSLQGTYPIYIKVEYGTATSAAIPQIWITVGTGTDGAGTITGTASTRTTIAVSWIITSTSTAYPSYACCVSGSVAIAWKLGSAAGNGRGFFAVVRTHDTSGSPTGDGFVVYAGASGSGSVCNSQSISISASTAYTVCTAFCFVPGQVTASLVSGNPQAYGHFAIKPDTWELPTLCTVIVSEVASGVSFSATMVGSTARTFLSIGYWGIGAALIGAGPGAIGSYGLAMVWE